MKHLYRLTSTLNYLIVPQNAILWAVAGLKRTTNTRRLFAMSAVTTMASIDAKPEENQIISHDGKEYSTIREGRAHILIPKVSGTKAAEQQVFYNPIQQFNRDLTILAITTHAKQVVEQKRIGRELKAAKKRKRQADDVGASSHKPKLARRALEAPTEPPPGSTEVGGPGGEANGKGCLQAEGEESRQSKPIPYTILDALSATGLRALRYAHEIPLASSITANDLSASAVASIELNVRHNKLGDKIRTTHSNALAHMYDIAARSLNPANQAERPFSKYDVIDLDPYGSAAVFFDAALQAVRDDGGLLCVTCTDAGVWASNGYPEKCFALYGGTPLRGPHSHEAGLRIVLHGLSSAAARHELAIEPLLSLSIDFYCRVFVRVTRSAAAVKFLAGKTMTVAACDAGCGTLTPQPLARSRVAVGKRGGEVYKHVFAQVSSDSKCAHCGGVLHVGGPMYAGPIHSASFVSTMLEELGGWSEETYGTKKRMHGMLTTALEELLPDEPAPAMGAIESSTSTKPTEPAQVPDKPDATGDEVTDVAAQNGNRDAIDACTSKSLSAERALARLDPAPFFFQPSAVAKAMRMQTPDEESIRGALRFLGWRVTRSHCKPGSIKTDAPWSEIWYVMRAWERQRAPVSDEVVAAAPIARKLLREVDTPREGSLAWKLERAGKHRELEFGDKLKALGKNKGEKKVVRYQVNPREHWGPLNRARG